MQIAKKHNIRPKYKVPCYECGTTKNVRTIFFDSQLIAKRRGVTLCEDCIDILTDLLVEKG